MEKRQLLGMLRAVTQLKYREAPAEELLGRFALDRDADAFSALVERFRGFVLRRCRTVLGHDDLALDAAQETFIALAKNARRLRGSGTLIRWLEKVARNKAKDIRRREQRVRRLAATVRPPVAGSDDGNAERLQRIELQEQVNQALAQLPRKHRQAVELCYLDGLTQREVATILETPAGTIAWRVQEGLAQLKRILGRRGVTPAALAMLPGLFARQAEAAVPLAQAWAAAAVAAAGTPSKLGFAWLGVGYRKAAIVALLVAALTVVAAARWPHLSRLAEPDLPAAGDSAVTAAKDASTDVETLQQRNLRILQGEVELKLVEALRSLVLGRGEVSVLSRAAHDHHVVCVAEVRHHTDQPDRTYASRYRFVYDMLADGFALWADPKGNGSFKSIDPQRPIILSRNPTTGQEIVVKIPALQEIERAFRLISPDRRAVAERTRVWENQPKTGVAPFIPGMVETWAGNSRHLFVKAGKWLWAAELGSSDLHWRCLGPCHGQHLAANEKSLFIVHEEQLLTRPAEGEAIEWTTVCKTKNGIERLAATRGLLFCVLGSELRVREPYDTRYWWPDIGQLAPPTAFFGSADMLYCVDKDHVLHSRPATQEEVWWTRLQENLPANVILAGGRLWAVDLNQRNTMCQSRVFANAGAAWQFAGTVIPVLSEPEQARDHAVMKQ